MHKDMLLLPLLLHLLNLSHYLRLHPRPLLRKRLLYQVTLVSSQVLLVQLLELVVVCVVLVKLIQPLVPSDLL